jgi:hypothetical protein
MPCLLTSHSSSRIREEEEDKYNPSLRKVGGVRGEQAYERRRTSAIRVFEEYVRMLFTGSGGHRAAALLLSSMRVRV